MARDFTVRFENPFWQVTARDAEAAGVAAGRPVVVERRLSGIAVAPCEPLGYNSVWTRPR